MLCNVSGIHCISKYFQNFRVFLNFILSYYRLSFTWYSIWRVVLSFHSDTRYAFTWVRGASFLFFHFSLSMECHIQFVDNPFLVCNFKKVIYILPFSSSMNNKLCTLICAGKKIYFIKNFQNLIFFPVLLRKKLFV